jgi:small subunit ribosomal protein S6
MVIFDAEVEVEEVEATVGRALDQLRARDAEVARVDYWGKRPLAYEIKHRWEGNYVVIEVLCDQVALSEFDRMLALADDVIRYKVVQLPDHAIGKRPTQVGLPASSSENGSPAASEPAGPAPRLGEGHLGSTRS